MASAFVGMAKKITTSKFDNVCMTSESDDVYEIAFDDGTILKATAEHPVLTAAGWKCVNELSIGMSIPSFGAASN